MAHGWADSGSGRWRAGRVSGRGLAAEGKMIFLVTLFTFGKILFIVALVFI